MTIDEGWGHEKLESCRRNKNLGLVLMDPLPASNFKFLTVAISNQNCGTHGNKAILDHDCVFISLSESPFQQQQTKKMFYCFHFVPAVCSEWSEPHSHCTEGAGSDQYSGLGKWKSNALKIEGYFSFLERLYI